MTDLIKVCQEWFPDTDGFWMDSKLKEQVDIAIVNVVDDWDFVFVITGGGEVRVGKSVLGLQIMVYWNYQMWKVHGLKVPFEVKKNVVFNWDKLIEAGNYLAKKGKFFALQYDEAGETMEGTKTSTSELKAIKDYLRECGQYNSLTILVMPEYFTLPIGIALTRSICLIDVYYTVNEKTLKFQRGYFRFYSRKAKKKLYIEGKKELNYKAAPYNFDGEFKNFYPIDEKEYRASKQKALQEREESTKNKFAIVRDALINWLNKDFGVKFKDMKREIYQRTGVMLGRNALQMASERAAASKPNLINAYLDDENEKEV